MKLDWSRPLLTRNNAKTIKGEGYGWQTLILYLSPSDMGGPNLCPHSTPGCVASCLNTAGRGTFDSVQKGRLHRTAKFHADRARFIARLDTEIGNAVKRLPRGQKLAVRLNGTSDINWLAVAPRLFIAWHDSVVFYDYTKNAELAARMKDSRYRLTYSRAEGRDAAARAVLAQGGNVSVVFNTKRGAPLPATWEGYRVIDGDTHDLRFLDPRGVVVGLRAKGRARRDTSGFVVPA